MEARIRVKWCSGIELPTTVNPVGLLRTDVPMIGRMLSDDTVLEFSGHVRPESEGD